MQDIASIQRKLNEDLFAATQEKCLTLCRVQDVNKASKKKIHVLCGCGMKSNFREFKNSIVTDFVIVYEKSDPQPSVHLIRLGERSNEAPKKKISISLRDVRTINFMPNNGDKRQSSNLNFDLRTADQEYFYTAGTAEEKKEFIINLRKVILKPIQNCDDFISLVYI